MSVRHFNVASALREYPCVCQLLRFMRRVDWLSKSRIGMASNGGAIVSRIWPESTSTTDVDFGHVHEEAS